MLQLSKLEILDISKNKVTIIPDEITPEIPSKTVKLPSSVFEVVLAHYLQHDLARFEQLIETWDSTIYDTASVVKAVGAKLVTRPRNTTFDVVSLFLLYASAQGTATALLIRLFPVDA